MHHRCHPTGLQGWPYFYREMKFTMFYICHTRRPISADYTKERSNRMIQHRNDLLQGQVSAEGPAWKTAAAERVEGQVGGLVNTCWSSIQNRHFRSGILESILLQLGKLSFCISLVCIFLGWTLIASQCFELPVQILWIFLCISSLLLWESRGHGSDSFIYFCKSLSSGVAVTSFIFLLGLTGFTTVMHFCYSVLLGFTMSMHRDIKLSTTETMHKSPNIMDSSLF